MNLLEHYIVKIISEAKIQNPENKRGYYRVNAIVDCCGHEWDVKCICPKCKKRFWFSDSDI